MTGHAQSAQPSLVGRSASELPRLLRDPRVINLVQADLNRLKSKPTLVASDVFANFAKVAHPYRLTGCAPTS
jgi:hypothetical protein